MMQNNITKYLGYKINYVKCRYLEVKRFIAKMKRKVLLEIIS